MTDPENYQLDSGSYVERALAKVEAKFVKCLTPSELAVYSALYPDSKREYKRIRWTDDKNVRAITNFMALENLRGVEEFRQGPDGTKEILFPLDGMLYRKIDSSFRHHLTRYAAEVQLADPTLPELSLAELAAAQERGEALPVITIDETQIWARLSGQTDLCYVLFKTPAEN